MAVSQVHFLGISRTQVRTIKCWVVWLWAKEATFIFFPLVVRNYSALRRRQVICVFTHLCRVSSCWAVDRQGLNLWLRMSLWERSGRSEPPGGFPSGWSVFVQREGLCGRLGSDFSPASQMLSPVTHSRMAGMRECPKRGSTHQMASTWAQMLSVCGCRQELGAQARPCLLIRPALVWLISPWGPQGAPSRWSAHHTQPLLLGWRSLEIWAGLGMGGGNDGTLGHQAPPQDWYMRHWEWGLQGGLWRFHPLCLFLGISNNSLPWVKQSHFQKILHLLLPVNPRKQDSLKMIWFYARHACLFCSNVCVSNTWMMEGFTQFSWRSLRNPSETDTFLLASWVHGQAAHFNFNFKVSLGESCFQSLVPERFVWIYFKPDYSQGHWVRGPGAA